MHRKKVGAVVVYINKIKLFGGSCFKRSLLKKTSVSFRENPRFLNHVTYGVKKKSVLPIRT